MYFPSSKLNLQSYIPSHGKLCYSFDNVNTQALVLCVLSKCVFVFPIVPGRIGTAHAQMGYGHFLRAAVDETELVLLEVTFPGLCNKEGLRCEFTASSWTTGYAYLYFTSILATCSDAVSDNNKVAQ